MDVMSNRRAPRGLRPRRARTALGSAVLALALALPAGAAPSPGLGANGLLRDVPADSRPAVADAVAQAEALRGALDSATYLSKVSGLLVASGARASQSPTTLPSAADLAATASLSPDLRQPVAELLAAVTQANALLGPLSPADVAAAVADLRATVPQRDEVRTGGIDPRTPGLAVLRSGARGDAPLAVQRASASLPGAALTVAAALDRALVALEAAPAGAAARTAAGCDVLDHAPLLCVGSEASNTYTTTSAVHIDLGGDDTYRTAVGAAPFLPAGGAAYVPVAVALDLGGNDTYHGAAVPGWAAYDLTLAQGAAGPGALGVLVDRRGDDRYVVAAPEPAEGRQGIVVAQGASLGGVAALFDGAGNDTYAVTATDSRSILALFAQGVGWNCPGTVAQTGPAAAGATCSVGALVDDGAGDDSYVVDAGTALGDDSGRGVRVAVAQGSALFGTGVLSDGGGRGVLRTLAGARRTDLLSFPSDAETPSAAVYGQASVIAGGGYLLTGDGPTTYELHADVEGTALGSVWGQAFGAGGVAVGMNYGDAVAVLDDRGGHDDYSARMTTHFSPDITVSDACRSKGKICASAQAQVDGFRTAGVSMLHAQASGGFDGVPVLRDRGGDDTYLAEHDVELDVELRDELTAPQAPPVLDVKPYPHTWLYGQGFALCGTSLLLDEDGRDSYRLRARSHTAASATSANATGTPQVTALSGMRLAHGQGSGLPGFICTGKQMNASLIDQGGTGDRFDVSALSTATTSPDPAGALQTGCCWGSFQGGVGGRFVADGQDVQVRSSPTQGVCSSSAAPRGFGQWANCWQQGTTAGQQTYDQVWLYPSAGRVTSATGIATRLEFLPGTVRAATAAGTIEVAARLTRADGSPVSGATVDFALQNQQLLWFFVDLGRAWFNIWHVTGVTGEDGVATVSLPVTLQQWNAVNKTTYVLNPNDYPFQVLAAAASDGTLHPAFASSPLALTLPE